MSPSEQLQMIVDFTIKNNHIAIKEMHGLLSILYILKYKARYFDIGNEFTPRAGKTLNMLLEPSFD